jgi:hypothetical protein
VTVTIIMAVMKSRVPPPEEIDDIARAAVAHRHTVERRLLRLPVRGAVGPRVDAELTRRGYLASEDAAESEGPRAA